MDTESDLGVVLPAVFMFQQWSSLPNLQSRSPPLQIYLQEKYFTIHVTSMFQVDRDSWKKVFTLSEIIAESAAIL